MKRLNKATSSIGLAAFVAVLLAGTANTASAATLSSKAFSRDGSIATTAPQALSGNLSPAVASIAEATYVAPDVVVPDPGINDENLVDEIAGDPITYGALFDIYVFDIDNTGGNQPTLFKNELAAIDPNDGVPPPVDFGVANLRFTWYAGSFDVLTSTTAASDLDFSLAAGSNAGFFDASNRLATGCGDSPCAPPDASGIATWKITDSDGVLNNSTIFFNYIGTGPATLLVTGSIIEPGGGGYVNIITPEQVPEPSTLTLAALAALSLLGLGRRRR